jgi:hypothetical protein
MTLTPSTAICHPHPGDGAAASLRPESANDEVVTPYTSAFMSGASVTNILLQQQCPLDQGEHLSMPYDHIVDADVLNALDPPHPVPIVCTPVLPVIGG